MAVSDPAAVRPGERAIREVELEAVPNPAPQRDYRVVQGCTLVTAVSYVMVNLLVDLLYATVDPRVRLGGRR